MVARHGYRDAGHREKVLAGDINRFLTQEIERLGGRAINLSFESGNNVLYGEKLLLEDEAGGAPIDLGYVGQVTPSRQSVIESLTYTSQVPSSVDVHRRARSEVQRQRRHGRNGCGRSVGGGEVDFLERCQRVRRDKKDPSTIIHSLTAAEANS